MEQFFTKAFEALSAEEKESFFRTVIMSDPSEYAQKLRVEFYATMFKSMGENV